MAGVLTLVQLHDIDWLEAAINAGLLEAVRGPRAERTLTSAAGDADGNS